MKTLLLCLLLVSPVAAQEAKERRPVHERIDTLGENDFKLQEMIRLLSEEVDALRKRVEMLESKLASKSEQSKGTTARKIHKAQLDTKLPVELVESKYRVIQEAFNVTRVSYLVKLRFTGKRPLKAEAQLVFRDQEGLQVHAEFPESYDFSKRGQEETISGVAMLDNSSYDELPSLVVQVKQEEEF